MIREAARELKTGDCEERFDAMAKPVAKAPPKEDKPKKVGE
jgi:hypothetical protein